MQKKELILNLILKNALKTVNAIYLIIKKNLMQTCNY